MSNTNLSSIIVSGLPTNLDEADSAYWRSLFDGLARRLLREKGLNELSILLSTANIDSQRDNRINSGQKEGEKKRNDELTVGERAEQYKPRESLFEFDFLILPKQVKDDILSAINLIALESKIFDAWNLRKIEPFPRTALNFHGEPGTGKTLAAHAIAHKLGRPILIASYAQIESKFHGDGPKNVEAIFYAAERDNAVLFIDEADSLLSKRLTNVTQGSEQAINSMRSQLLICLEQYKGIVIFATNLVSNYDKAFETRVRSIYFPLPDKEGREAIWRQHLFFEGGPPLANDVSLPGLSEIDGVCGRDIKNSVIEAALQAVQDNKSAISMQNLVDAVDKIKGFRIQDADEKILIEKIKSQIE